MNNKMKQYREKTASFCYYLALLEEMNRMLDRGNYVKEEVVKEVLEGLAARKDAFLSAKRALGLSGDLGFLDPDECYQFDGFRIDKGHFFGNPQNVEAVCAAWLTEIDKKKTPDEDSATRFEVAVYAVMVSGGAGRLLRELLEEKEDQGARCSQATGKGIQKKHKKLQKEKNSHLTNRGRKRKPKEQNDHRFFSRFFGKKEIEYWEEKDENIQGDL